MQPLMRKSRSKKILQRPLAAKPLGGVAQICTAQLGDSMPTMAESLADLTHRKKSQGRQK